MHGKYNLIPVRFNKIWKRFLCKWFQFLPSPPFHCRMLYRKICRADTARLYVCTARLYAYLADFRTIFSIEAKTCKCTRVNLAAGNFSDVFFRNFSSGLFFRTFRTFSSGLFSLDFQDVFFRIFFSELLGRVQDVFQENVVTRDAVMRHMLLKSWY